MNNIKASHDVLVLVKMVKRLIFHVNLDHFGPFLDHFLVHGPFYDTKDEK